MRQCRWHHLGLVVAIAWLCSANAPCCFAYCLPGYRSTLDSRAGIGCPSLDGVDEQCYHYHHGNSTIGRARTWLQAEYHCMRTSDELDVHLASVESAAVARWLTQCYPNETAAPRGVWIGGFRDDSARKETSADTGWTWTDGSEFRWSRWTADTPAREEAFPLVVEHEWRNHVLQMRLSDGIMTSHVLADSRAGFLCEHKGFQARSKDAHKRPFTKTLRRLINTTNSLKFRSRAENRLQHIVTASFPSSVRPERTNRSLHLYACFQMHGDFDNHRIAVDNVRKELTRQLRIQDNRLDSVEILRHTKPLILNSIVVLDEGQKTRHGLIKTARSKGLTTGERTLRKRVTRRNTMRAKRDGYRETRDGGKKFLAQVTIPMERTIHVQLVLLMDDDLYFDKDNRTAMNEWLNLRREELAKCMDVDKLQVYDMKMRDDVLGERYCFEFKATERVHNDPDTRQARVMVEDMANLMKLMIERNALCMSVSGRRYELRGERGGHASKRANVDRTSLQVQLIGYDVRFRIVDQPIERRPGVESVDVTNTLMGGIDNVRFVARGSNGDRLTLLRPIRDSLVVKRDDQGWPTTAPWVRKWTTAAPTEKDTSNQMISITLSLVTCIMAFLGLFTTLFQRFRLKRDQRRAKAAAEQNKTEKAGGGGAILSKADNSKTR